MNSHRVIAVVISVCSFLISGGTVLAGVYPDYASHDTRDSIEIVSAYIDPGSAGFIITTVLGFIAAVRLYHPAVLSQAEGHFLFGKSKG